MFTNLKKGSLKVGIKINRTKSKEMFNVNKESNVMNTERKVHEYDDRNYIDQFLKVDKVHENETKRCTGKGWKGFDKHGHI